MSILMPRVLQCYIQQALKETSQRRFLGFLSKAPSPTPLGSSHLAELWGSSAPSVEGGRRRSRCQAMPPCLDDFILMKAGGSADRLVLPHPPPRERARGRVGALQATRFTGTVNLRGTFSFSARFFFFFSG